MQQPDCKRIIPTGHAQIEHSLPRAELNKYFTEGQMEVRAGTLRTAYKLARQLVLEVAK